MRLNPLLETIIDPAQTAYVPGRSVMDNIRCNNFFKEYCRSKGIKAALVSLDAKKAFDSVDHEYIDEVLEQYGFGHTFRNYFRILYKDISAKILVNGYFSDKIDIERGVKQGDALSCAIFILCIDPLIRNLNNNAKIKGVRISSKLTKETINHKASGFADDISVITMNDIESINNIFYEYQRLTNKSGLTLNADKTEILNLTDENKTYKVNYERKTFNIVNVTKLKICGIHFCTSKIDEYQLNVLEKIEKLKTNLRKWESRRLTLEGKSLILKTFGISQLIYSMQCINIKMEDLKLIEKLIFGFLWKKNDFESARAGDRVKRSIMKNDYCKGGLKITDIECMDRSLKLKQYIRASYSTHNVNKVQVLCVEKSDSHNILDQEFSQISEREGVCKIAQETINIITDFTRLRIFGEDESNFVSTIAINQISMTNINTFLERKNQLLLKCIAKPIINEGNVTFLDLVESAEIEMHRNKSDTMESLIRVFPKYYRDAANSFNENINVRQNNITHFLSVDMNWIPIKEITTRDLQWILKNALNRLSVIKLKDNVGLEIEKNEEIDFVQFRKNCRNPQLRNIYFRLIHNDFYTYERMYKFKMTPNPYCPRCGEVETTKHLLWECNESQKIWKIYNEILNKAKLHENCVINYSDIYKSEQVSALSTVKMIIIKEFIQIIRPTRWNKEIIINLILNIKKIELYNSVKLNKLEFFNEKWNIFEYLTATS